MSRKGQICIPAEIRDRFGLAKGDIFRVGGHNGVVVIQKIPKMTDAEAKRLANGKKRSKVRLVVTREGDKPAPAEKPAT